MWTETTEGRKFIEEISQGLVTQVAPEELELFDELMEEYFRDPTPPDLSTTTKDDPLGFGLAETLVAVTPAAASVVSVVLTYLLTEVIRATQEEAATALKNKIKAFFNPEQDESGPTLTEAQLEQVKKLARKQAVQFGLNAKQAEKMSNALVGSLALAK